MDRLAKLKVLTIAMIIYELTFLLWYSFWMMEAVLLYSLTWALALNSLIGIVTGKTIMKFPIRYRK